ncbi:MAG: alpha/beta hydrolase [Lachnospiraceae bacterium]|nr:alpha/beta hydrolase [Lachnospiraceae bacterium]
MLNRYFEINTQNNNIRCKCYYSENGKAGNAIICCTGFAGHKDNTATERFAGKLISKRKDTIVVVFNWPSHGDDIKKKLLLEDCDAYLDIIIREVKETQGIEDIFSYATSFGAYIVLKYISEHDNPFRKIALRCPAVDMYDLLTRTVMNGDEYDRIMKGKDVQVGFDRKIIVNRKLLEDMKQNDIRKREYLDYADDILIIHGTRDEIVPFESVKEFAEDNVIEFIPVEGADHRFQNPTHLSLADKHAMQFFGLC